MNKGVVTSCVSWSSTSTASCNDRSVTDWCPVSGITASALVTGCSPVRPQDDTTVRLMFKAGIGDLDDFGVLPQKGTPGKERLERKGNPGKTARGNTL